MSNKITLICTTTSIDGTPQDGISQKLELPLHSYAPNIYSMDYSKCERVIEDGSYRMDVTLDSTGFSDTAYQTEIYVNGSLSGCSSLKKVGNTLAGSVFFIDLRGEYNQHYGKPFLLLYDFVIISIKITDQDDNPVEFYTDFMLCLSTHQSDVENINNILNDLSKFNDSQIGEWLFNGVNKGTSVGLMEGEWHSYTYKSLNSYIQLIEDIVLCYKDNFAYFQSMGTHTLATEFMLLPYDKINKITRNSFNWILQNSEQLTEVFERTGMQYNNKYYVPAKIKTEIKHKSSDTYENRVIVSFLYTTLTSADYIYKSFNCNFLIEETRLNAVLAQVPAKYCAPIITIKSCQVSFNKILLARLDNLLKTMRDLYFKYSLLFNLRDCEFMKKIPRKSKVFQEVRPYTQVFERIMRWFQYGEFSLAKDNLILQIKTLDKLFEYFCLFKLLSIFSDNGFTLANQINPVGNFEYVSDDKLYHNDRDIANTFVLQKHDVKATLYYQPVISSKRFENGLKLYRTRHMQRYFTPDFVIKFENNDSEEYVILDAKFSNRTNIINKYLPDVMLKYANEIAVNADIKTPVMVWILQGRTDDSYDVYRFHNSPLAKLYKQSISFGIIKFSTLNKTEQNFWNVLSENVSVLSM